jgi:serine phosphatase RsbU (regulator of sigma subunit)
VAADRPGHDPAGIAARLTGHPRPLPLRGRKIVAELSCDPVLPFGLGDGAPEPRVAELEPDEAVLLYTDGVTEARTADGEQFGLDRLVDLLEREAASGRTAEELLRRLVRGRTRASGRRPARRRHPAAGAVDRYLTGRQPH